MSLKDAEGKGGFWGFLSVWMKRKIAVAAGREGMWKSALSISTFPPYAAAGSCAEPELVEELCFGLLHEHCGFGVTVCGGNAFEGIEA